MDLIKQRTILHGKICSFIINIETEIEIPKCHLKEFNEWCDGLIFEEVNDCGKGYAYFNTEEDDFEKDVVVTFLRVNEKRYNEKKKQ